ncbi:MAG: hypothetical protein Q4C13_08585 [Clostridia bacterium]|nr:hypothetical protein [Clostridia bacterium]
MIAFALVLLGSAAYSGAYALHALRRGRLAAMFAALLLALAALGAALGCLLF